jgi:hypothetical protein
MTCQVFSFTVFPEVNNPRLHVDPAQKISDGSERDWLQMMFDHGVRVDDLFPSRRSDTPD